MLHINMKCSVSNSWYIYQLYTRSCKFEEHFSFSNEYSNIYCNEFEICGKTRKRGRWRDPHLLHKLTTIFYPTTTWENEIPAKFSRRWYPTLYFLERKISYVHLFETFEDVWKSEHYFPKCFQFRFSWFQKSLKVKKWRKKSLRPNIYTIFSKYKIRALHFDRLDFCWKSSNEVT